MNRLQEQGTAVYLVSGGFRRVIQRAAEQLDIPDENIFANRLQFDDEGTVWFFIFSFCFFLSSVLICDLTLLMAKYWKILFRHLLIPA